MEEDYLELLELQALIREGVEEALPGSVRVRAEIASIQRRSNGHCYLELCESGPRGPVAKARAVIWRSAWEPIAAKFSEATGGTLHEGLSLIFQVSVSYSELYGLSLIVEDIDVGAVLGEAELARRRTIERLTQEGLMDLQKELTLPDVPYSIAVISAPDAAGYGDFRRHLLENEYGFSFAITLFPATMQGDSAPASIASALDNVICH
ncbi:MAG: exodeoxyribonuclease VII large subunit, partial [Bacteroidales bacterium]|nr:exodeoxyribonuclease VII large subunit [Bacteroidales bacterium]